MADSKPFTASVAYQRYALGVFLAVYIVNFIDRQIFGILIEPIRQEIDLSDTQLGLLGGIAFALFYTFAGIPIARWADVSSRKNIVAAAILIWSGMTMFTGTAKTFGTLLLARIGVGIGEAGCSPPIHSMISDLFPEEKRATALSIYALGIPIGGAIGTLAGGWIGAYFGWRTAFFVVGVPGILVSAIVYFTIKEPPRGFSEKKPIKIVQVPLKKVAGFMWKMKAFRHMSLASALHAFVGYGVALFLPSFYMRVHGLGLKETSTYLFVIGLTGVVGTFLGGYLGDKFGVHDKRWYMWIPCISTILTIPFAVVFYTTTNVNVALIVAVPITVFGAMYLGPTFAMTQSMVPPSMRALASAILLFILNLIGLGLGPVFAGALSDFFKEAYAEQSIRYSLFILAVVGNLWSAIHYYFAAKTLRVDLEAKNNMT